MRMINTILFTKTAFLRFIYVNLFLTCALPLFASDELEVISLKEENQSYDIAKQARVFVDDKGSYSFEQIKSLPESSFQPHKNFNFGLSKKTYWIKMQIQSLSVDQDWLLEVAHPVLDHVDLFTPQVDGTYTTTFYGDTLPFYDRHFKHRTFLFELPLKTNDPKTFYLKVSSESTVSIPMKIWNEKAMTEHKSDEQILFGLYYGLILAMALYNLFLFIYVKDLSYLFYVMYIVSFGLLQMSLNGLAFQYVWPNSTWLASYAPTFLIPFSVSFIIQFTRYFILSAKNSPRMDKFFKVWVWLGIILTVNAMVVSISSILWIIVAYILFGLPFMIGTAIYVWRKGYKPAAYYLISWSAFFIGGLLYSFKSLGILPNIFITTYGIQIGGAMEVILLSIALAARINMMKKEKEDAQKYAIEMQTLLANSYARFVPKQFLSNLGKDSILDVKLGDQISKEMTVMFADIRSFTDLSEKMTPEQNFNFINSYLGRMSPIIQSNHGYIDKFMGDGIMALFDGTPDNALNAAIQMQKHILVYNLHRNKQGYEQINIGIGMHTGRLMLGAIGGIERMEGTVISDSVNLGSRIEGLTKIYGIKIAISEKTFLNLNNPNNFHFRFLDRVQVKGKKQAISIYEAFDGDTETSFELKFKTMSTYEIGIEFYYRKQFKEAKECFLEVLKTNPSDKVSNIYLQRADYYLVHDIEDNWDGISVLTEK